MAKETEDLKFPIRLFVYGTLKRGFGNNRYLKDCNFSKRASAYGILLDLGGYPGFLPCTTGSVVGGEVWEIPNKEALDAIDGLEGHPHHYTRTKILIVGAEEVWTYVYTRYYTAMEAGLKGHWQMIPSGEWTANPKASTTEFMGFITHNKIPKTSHPAVAHLKIDGQFAGLIDCQSGKILRVGYRAEGKPHLTYDHTQNCWINSDIKTPQVTIPITSTPPPVTTPPKVEFIPYQDPSDPGEVDAPVKNQRAA